VLALAFIALLGVLATSLLTVAYGSFKTTEVARSSNARLYAADGGADIGVELVRSSNSCDSAPPSPAEPLTVPAINDWTVDVTCQTTSLSVGTGSGGVGVSTHSLIVTGYPSPNGSMPNLVGAVTANSSQKGDLIFDGPAFNAGGFGFSGNGARLVFNSNLDEYDSPNPYCTDAKAAAASNGKLTVAGAWTCREPGTAPPAPPCLATTAPAQPCAVPDPLPTLKVPASPAPAPVTSGGCTTMFPGKYTTAPSFSSSGNYYLASGVYYFENVGTFKLNGTIFGGQPGPGVQQKFTGISPCSSDASANALVPGSASGAGVELVLGGNSSISVANSTSSKTELYARIPGNASAEGTAGVSIYAPRTGGTGYLAWNAISAFNQSNAKPQIVIHGLVYVPNSSMTVLMVTNGSASNAPIFTGGLVVQTLTINTTGSQQFATAFFSAVPESSAGTTVRTVVVEATAKKAGSADVTVRVVIQLDTAAPDDPPTILSWRKV